RHRGDLGAEIEELERAERLAARRGVYLVPVDVREARDLRGGLDVRTPEREGLRPVELRVRLRVHGRAVREDGRDVHALGGERQVDRLRGGAHCEQEAAV